MRLVRFGVLAIGLALAVSAAPNQAYAGDQQCYYGLTDPVNSCTACARICLGSGFKCCTIVTP